MYKYSFNLHLIYSNKIYYSFSFGLLVFFLIFRSSFYTKEISLCDRSCRVFFPLPFPFPLLYSRISFLNFWTIWRLSWCIVLVGTIFPVVTHLFQCCLLKSPYLRPLNWDATFWQINYLKYLCLLLNVQFCTIGLYVHEPTGQCFTYWSFLICLSI